MTDDGLGADLVANDGLYAGTIPGQPAGTLVAFRILASDAASPPATAVFPADAPRREALIRFGERTLPEAFGTYRLWITQANVDQWAAREKMSNEDLDVTFVAGDHRVIYNAGAHYSGSAYTSPGYNSPVGALCGYDLRTPEDDLYLGERHLTLDWPVRDATNQREQLMFWFLEQLRLPNLHRRYVHLSVNGLQRGTLYDDVQQPGDDVLSEWFPDDADGSLFKTDCLYEFDDHNNRLEPCVLNTLQNFTTTGGLKKTARYRWNWRPRAIGTTANDFRDLFALVDAMNAPASNYLATVQNTVDVEHWMRTFAMNDLASFWDAFGNPNAKNTFLYKPTRDSWKLLCWDFDVGLGAFVDPVDAPLFPNLDDPTMNRFYTVPAFLRHYWRTLEESVHSFFRPEAVTPILAAKYDAFQAAGIPLASPFVPSGAFGLSITDWIAQRRSFLLAELARVSTIFSIAAPQTLTTNRNTITLTGTAPLAVANLTVNGIVFPTAWTSVKTWSLSLPLALGTNTLTIAGLDRAGQPVPQSSGTRIVISTATPPNPGQIVFNEWMADNASAVSDPADGQFDDWFELYNPTDQPADLGGYWLSDDDLTPQRFVIPQGTLVPARGFLLLWADDQSAQTGADLHLNFRLGKSGETLTLRDPSGRTVDRLQFGPQREDVSEGRFPDGNPSSILPLPFPTPRAPNARPTAPPIRVLGIEASIPEQITLTWTSAPGYLYRVQASATLQPGSWTDHPGDVTATGPSTALTVPAPADFPHRFYRVVALP